MKPLKNLANLKSDHLEDLTPGARTVIKKQGKARIRALDKEAIKEALEMMVQDKELDKIEIWVNFAFRPENQEFNHDLPEVEEPFFNFGFESEYEEDDPDMEPESCDNYDNDYDEFTPPSFDYRKDRDLCSLFPY